ncbi:FecR family protein [Pedobacter sp. MC2016-24]|uniref:FecR family protein n=1 Tax=Pedobacter sp. MC2016-24 TaxID=2780090 RepID=UPI0018827290|nr:FecR domain-containing protein [Pedobacter sp. MC2016-24]MBE9598476.1 FecR domain-containing protein [Pedobacter sp. MC2016-24]
MDTTSKPAGAKALLKKYQDGKCNPEEERQVLRWYYSFNEADDLDLEETNRIQLLKQVNHNVLTAIKDQVDPKYKLRFRMRAVMSIAASLALFFSVALFFYNQQMEGRHSAKLNYRKVITLAGQRKIISLADGSKIWLNNSSTLRYPEHFADSTRTVFLEGEAFFDVAHDLRKPFIVGTGKLSVQVLGTSFNVKHDQAEHHMEVVVASGQVGVTDPSSKHTWMLHPGEQLVYNTLTEKSEMRVVDPTDYTGWQAGVLVFRHEKLEAVCKRLERWYGVSILIRTAALKNRKISLRQKDESLEKVLKMLGKAVGFKYVKLNEKGDYAISKK